jgi:hypothetical protein
MRTAITLAQEVAFSEPVIAVLFHVGRRWRGVEYLERFATPATRPRDTTGRFGNNGEAAIGQLTVGG